jgi:hypothetical protein
MPFMEKMTPTCDIISEKISRSMDEQISIRDRFQIRLHTMGCILCERYRKQLMAIRLIVEKLTHAIEEVDSEQKSLLSHETKSRIKKAIQKENE